MADAAENSVNNMFTAYQTSIESEQAIREDIRDTTKELDKSTKQLQSILQGIHFLPSKLKEVCEKARELLDSKVKPEFKTLESKVPAGEYYRFHDIWRPLMQRVSGSCALVHYLETEGLADRLIVANMLGVKAVPKEANIYLDMEDYLNGLLQMSSELSRFTVNCVTNGDYSRPARIGKFMSELNNGFRELNLKNDYLRKRFDGLKYDVKKIEEVIYDVSIRGLSAPNQQPNNDNKTGDGNVEGIQH